MQARERELGLGLDASRAQDLEVRRARGRRVQQRALAEPRRPGDEQRRTLPGPRVGQQLAQPGEFCVAADDGAVHVAVFRC